MGNNPVPVKTTIGAYVDALYDTSKMPFFVWNGIRNHMMSAGQVHYVLDNGKTVPNYVHMISAYNHGDSKYMDEQIVMDFDKPFFLFQVGWLVNKYENLGREILSEAKECLYGVIGHLITESIHNKGLRYTKSTEENDLLHKLNGMLEMEKELNSLENRF